MNQNKITGSKAQEDAIKQIQKQILTSKNQTAMLDLINQIRRIQNAISFTSGQQFGYHQGIQLSYAFD